MVKIIEQPPRNEAPAISIDIMEADRFLREHFEHGERPVVTLPKEYLETAQKGLREHTTWDPDVQCIAGTFGTEPYCPSNEERMAIILRNVRLSQIHPRATGPDKKFHGIVTIDGPIMPDAFEILPLEEYMSTSGSVAA